MSDPELARLLASVRDLDHLAGIVQHRRTAVPVQLVAARTHVARMVRYYTQPVTRGAPPSAQPDP